MKFAHLSDPHFAAITYNPLQLFSKQWLGNLNLLLFRDKTHETDLLKNFGSILKELSVSFLCITGDFATTAWEKEFSMAKQWVETIPIPVFSLPGNHDIYTKSSEKQRLFYKTFPSSSQEFGFSLEKDRIEVRKLNDTWWYIGLDCALATSLILSNGVFFKSLEQNLMQALQKIDPKDHIIVANHFPYFCTNRPRHDLKYGEILRGLLKQDKRVKAYLHGHDHTPEIYTTFGNPVVFNAGSCSHNKHRLFYILDLQDKHLKCASYRFTDEGGYALCNEHTFELDSFRSH